MKTPLRKVWGTGGKGGEGVNMKTLRKVWGTGVREGEVNITRHH